MHRQKLTVCKSIKPLRYGENGPIIRPLMVSPISASAKEAAQLKCSASRCFNSVSRLLHKNTSVFLAIYPPDTKVNSELTTEREREREIASFQPSLYSLSLVVLKPKERCKKRKNIHGKWKKENGFFENDKALECERIQLTCWVSIWRSEDVHQLWWRNASGAPVQTSSSSWQFKKAWQQQKSGMREVEMTYKLLTSKKMRHAGLSFHLITFSQPGVFNELYKTMLTWRGLF